MFSQQFPLLAGDWNEERNYDYYYYYYYYDDYSYGGYFNIFGLQGSLSGSSRNNFVLKRNSPVLFWETVAPKLDWKIQL